MADEQDFDEHDDEEKQVSEDPINTSTPSGPMANNSNRTYNNQYNFKQHNKQYSKQYNNQYKNQYNNNSNLSQAPPAAFTFQPQQFQPFQPPLPEFSSQAAVPSPKTHFYSPNKFNAHNVHNKQSQSFSPLHSPPAMHQQSKSHPNIGLHVKHINNIHKKNHPIVKQLVDMGFPQNYVERACKIFKKNFGSKPYRLEVLTEIILRLQRKDGNVKGQSLHVQHHRSHNKSLELLLNRHKDKIALEDSTTALIKNDVKFRRNSNSYIINKNKNNLILVQVISGPSITKTINEDICEVHIKADQTLTDLKSLLSQLNKNEYIFYHESGFIFNDNNLTIRQCMNDLSAVGYIFDDNTLTLKIGIFAQRKSSKKKLKIKPLPPRNMALPVTNMNVMGRNRSKSTKLDIIKSKIQIETNKNFREIITYIKDSPFWWKTMNEGTERVKKLTNRLKSIARLISELCQLLNKFSTHCNKLSMDVMKSWESIENEFCGDVLSLNAQFFNLGDTISTLSTSSAMLSMTLDKVIVEQFHEFCDLHLSKLLVSNKRLISMKNEYESELQYILHNKAEKGENNDNIRANKCENLRKLYELTRYDHCIILNNIINRHRYDIILDLCAAFCAFETFFHLGYEASLSHKQFHDSIRLGLSEKNKQRKIYFEQTVNKNRRILVETLSQGLEHNEYKKRIRAVNNKKFKNKANMNMIQFNPQEENEFIPKKDRIRFKHVSLDYYDGYLWKQSSKSKKKWQKRWFVLTNGELEYFRNPKQRNKIKNKNKGKNGQNKEYIGNTALCKVKKAVEHDFNYVFSIITPSQRVYVLQAQTGNAYDEWFYVLSNQCARLILRKNTIDRFKRRRKEIEMKSYSINDQNNYIFVEKERLKKEIFHLNKFCADCDRINPEWCSINIGVLLCMECCGVHRGLGTHISKMRSLKLDDVSVINLKLISNIGGNEKLNGELLESCADGAFSGCEFFNKINCESCTAKERSNFIKNKYMFKMFLNPMQIMEIQQKKKNINQLLWNAVANNDFFKVLYCLYYGADINYQFVKYNNATVIHEAVQRNYTEMVQLLIHNEGNANLEDGNEQKANQIAIKESLNNIDNTEIQNILKTAVY